MPANSDFQKLTARIEALTDEMVEFQKAMTAIPALSPKSGGEGEWDKAMMLEEYLKKIGIKAIERIDIPDSDAKNGVRPNLLARIPGKSPERVVWIMAHIDVVPPGDLGLWSHDPWEAVVKDGLIYGRGTEDNQQGVASAVFAARAFIEEGIQPERTLAILLCADEETGSALGLEAVLKQHPDYFSPEHLIIAPDIGAPDSTMIEVAEKSILWLKFTTSGKQCHASKPDNGINAMEAASELIVRLKELRERYPAQEPIFIPPESTFVPTKREANVPNVNTMPGEDIFCMDCRLLPEVDVDEVLAVIHEICGQVEKATGVTIACDIEMRADSAPSTPPDAPIVHALKASVREVYGREAKPMGVGGGTVAAIFRRAGLPAAVWATINQTAHQPDESCAIANMVGDAKVFAHVCMQRG